MSELLACRYLALKVGEGQRIIVLELDIQSNEQEVTSQAQPHHHGFIGTSWTLKAAEVEMSPQELCGLAEV